MTIPLIDLVAQYHTIRTEIDAAIRGVLESGVFILGSNVAALEAELAAYLGHLFVIRVAAREGVRRRLAELGIASAIYYPLPVHRLSPYREQVPEGACPEADRAAEETLAIPLYPEMTDDMVRTVAAAVGEAVRVAVNPGT